MRKDKCIDFEDMSSVLFSIFKLLSIWVYIMTDHFIINQLYKTVVNNIYEIIF